MDGIEATRRIRRIEATGDLAGTYIAALTANTVPKDEERSREAGMNAFLKKPIQTVELMDVLQVASQSRKPVVEKA